MILRKTSNETRGVRRRRRRTVLGHVAKTTAVPFPPITPRRRENNEQRWVVLPSVSQEHMCEFECRRDSFFFLTFVRSFSCLFLVALHDWCTSTSPLLLRCGRSSVRGKKVGEKCRAPNRPTRKHLQRRDKTRPAFESHSSRRFVQQRSLWTHNNGTGSQILFVSPPINTAPPRQTQAQKNR